MIAAFTDPESIRFYLTASDCFPPNLDGNNGVGEDGRVVKISAPTAGLGALGKAPSHVEQVVAVRSSDRIAWLLSKASRATCR